MAFNRWDSAGTIAREKQALETTMGQGPKNRCLDTEQLS